jgi:glucoamylase
VKGRLISANVASGETQSAWGNPWQTRSHASGDISVMGTPSYAPGWPGIPPRWTSSAKSGIGTALRASSRIWFTLSHGILNEVYYPRLDQACLRDLGLLITDARTFVSEEKRDTSSRLEWLAPGVPGFRLVNTCREGRYRVVKEILTDPRRDVLLQQTQLQLLSDDSGYHVYVLLAPHLGNAGWQNTAWVGDYKGVPMLFAQRDGFALAVASTPNWTRAAAGFVGVSDGWQDVMAHQAMTWSYDRAENGNVALIGEVNLLACDGTFVTALAFGNSAAEAGHRARASLLDGFAAARAAYVLDWTTWQQRLEPLALFGPDTLPRVSAAVLRCHEEKRLPGAIIASLSIPWGDTKSDNDLGGYHLVWPRDLVEVAGGLLAAGAYSDARRVLAYLRVTQNADGCWPQNMWVDGEPYWHGIQLDETAFPILLLDLIQRNTVADQAVINGFWPMVRQAAAFLVRNGPGTEQDRWEEDAGLSPFTVAVEVAALLVAAGLADRVGEPVVGQYLRETADAWNDSLDASIYVEGTDLARRVGVEGYYVRIAPPETADAASPVAGFVPIKNRPWPQADGAAIEMVSPDALALVRFGLRAPDDPRILNTVKVIDALLKVDLPFGPVWRRYNGDGYGEHADGSAFDGAGVGRPWPLLTGERAHYEIAAGHIDEGRRLLRAFEACANEGGLLPEQVWDASHLPERELFQGRPTGAAMPLAWAHAEHLKLVRSLHDGRVFDLPVQTWQRYVIEHTRSRHAWWRFNHRLQRMDPGLTLRLETLVPCLVHWSADGWCTSHDTVSRDPGLGEHIVDLPTEVLPVGTTIAFTFYWTEVNRWEQVDFQVVITSTSPTRSHPG